MALAVKIDELGFYIQGSDLSDYEGEETEEIILTLIPSGFWHPKYNRSQKTWEEGLTKIEIAQRSGLPQTLAEAKTYVQQQIRELAGRKQEALIAGYSAAERDTWDRKEHEAKLLLETNDLNQAKYLKAEAIAMTGASSDEDIMSASKQLGQLILNKADQLRTASALISGTRARKWAEVEALDDVQQVLAYPVEQGW